MAGEALSLNYSRRDPDDVLADIKSQLVTLSNGKWTDFTESDIGYAALKAHVGLNDFNAFFIDQALCESFLSTARDRESVIRLAKMLGYVIDPLLPAQGAVQLTFPTFNSPVVIPAGATWRVNNLTYTNPNEIDIPSGQSSQRVTLQQGVLYSNTVVSNGQPWQEILLPTNLANLKVVINSVEWDIIDSFINAPSQTSVKISDNNDGSSTLTFGANINTLTPPVGTVITITGIITLGAAGNIYTVNNNVYLVSIVRDGGGHDITGDFSGVSVGPFLGGRDPESTESIRTNAPKFFSAQKRACNEDDWTVLVSKIAGVTRVNVVGGEKVKDYGTVHCTVYSNDPTNVTRDFLNFVHDEALKFRICPIIPVIEAPIIHYLTMTGVLTLAPGLTLAQQTQAIADVSTAVSKYINTLDIGGEKNDTANGGFFNSSLDAAAIAQDNVVASTFSYTVATKANLQANVLKLPLFKNYDVTHAVLTDAHGNVIWSGDATSKIVNGYFIYTTTGLSDQLMTLSYASNSRDVLLLYNHIVYLHSLNLSIA